MHPTRELGPKNPLLWAAVFMGCISAAPVSAQPKPEQTFADIRLTVLQRLEIDATSRPFPSVGMFNIIEGESPMEKVCPSKSNQNGSVVCRIACTKKFALPRALILRPPGPEAVPGYESPVSKEIEISGCTLTQDAVTFVYVPLSMALRETLMADPHLRNAVAKPDGQLGFADLKPFSESSAQLAVLIESEPDNPNAKRFAHILNDASLAKGHGLDPAGIAQVEAYSVGTKSIYLNQRIKRSFGQTTADKVAPVTADWSRLRDAHRTTMRDLEVKSDKTPPELQMEEMLKNKQPGEFKFPKSNASRRDWNKSFQEGAVAPRATDMPLKR